MIRFEGMCVLPCVPPSMTISSGCLKTPEFASVWVDLCAVPRGLDSTTLGLLAKLR